MGFIRSYDGHYYQSSLDNSVLLYYRHKVCIMYVYDAISTSFSTNFLEFKSILFVKLHALIHNCLALTTLI